MAHFGGAGVGGGAFGGATTFAAVSLASSAAATDRTAEFLRLAAAAKAAQVRDCLHVILRLCLPLLLLEWGHGEK